MKKILAAVIIALMIVFITLAAVFSLVETTLNVAAVRSPLMRALGLCAEFVLGILLLLGTVYLATHIAVRIFSGGRPPRALNSSGGLTSPGA